MPNPSTDLNAQRLAKWTDLAARRPDVHADLAEYHVLNRFDDLRRVRYGDMARARRAGELNRRASKLIDAGVPVLTGDRPGEFPRVSQVALVAAFERVGRPRFERVQRETYRHGTRYTAATVDAWHALADELGTRVDR